MLYPYLNHFIVTLLLFEPVLSQVTLPSYAEQASQRNRVAEFEQGRRKHKNSAANGKTPHETLLSERF